MFNIKTASGLSGFWKRTIMKTVQCQKVKNSTVSVPGSKSYTHRTLIAAALSRGRCSIENHLQSEDTLLTRRALEAMGIRMTEEGDRLIVHGSAGELKPCPDPIDLKNSGTSMRLLTAVAALGRGSYVLTGSLRMQQRPVRDLLDALGRIDVSVHSLNQNGCPPVKIVGGRLAGGITEIDCSVSSQYLSALLMIAPYTTKGMEIIVTGGPVSRPYIDMTIDIMNRFGVEVFREGYTRFRVEGGQVYRAGDYGVEPDCSQAGYFWAAGAVTGARVKVLGITATSCQGDVRFAKVLEMMGCRVRWETDGISVSGGRLSAVQVDMSDMPDMVPTLAVVAAFAEGTTIIENVAHLKEKESDRLASVAAELSAMGITATCSDTGLVIEGGEPVGASIATYNDHRIAMSFAVAGLKTPGVAIQDEMCVEKSFPNFWEVFETLYATR
jgi:3-phosphoshikimate 1-carboxyvinyltransferase